MSKQKIFSFHLGLLAAMPQELGKISENLQNIKKIEYGDLTTISGVWKGSTPNKLIYITAAWSGWGKVSAARASTRLLTSEYEGKKIDFVIFTGVAGAARGFLKQWDIVISESAVQHDMDARPLFGQYFIPIINQKFLKPNQNFLKSVFQVLLKAKDNGKLKKYGKIYQGLIATGDKFISDKKIIENLYNDFPEILAVEMEGAAFAQVASQEGINWIILRTISDSADESADTNFNSFLNDYEIYSWDLIESLLLFFNFHTMNN